MGHHEFIVQRGFQGGLAGGRRDGLALHPVDGGDQFLRLRFRQHAPEPRHAVFFDAVQDIGLDLFVRFTELPAIIEQGAGIPPPRVQPVAGRTIPVVDLIFRFLGIAGKRTAGNP